MGRGRKHILDEMTSYFPNAKSPLLSTGDLRALHMAERYPFISSPSPNNEVKRSLTWGECTEILQHGKWVKIASKVRFLLERQPVHNSWYCLWENKRRIITIFVLILFASLWFQQQPLLCHIHSLVLLLVSLFEAPLKHLKTNPRVQTFRH